MSISENIKVFVRQRPPVEVDSTSEVAKHRSSGFYAILIKYMVFLA
jgi:hypothetical protein